MAESGVPGRSSTVDLDGPVHYVDFGGPEEGPAVVLVHGLGGSHLNWDLVAPLLQDHARVWAIDLPGFGRSEPGSRKASVTANVGVLHRFLTEVVDEPAVLVGNSMGGMISILEAGERPEAVRGLVLLDPAVPGPRRALDPLVAVTFALYAIPFVGERFLSWRRQRRTALGRVREMLHLVGVDPDQLPAHVIDRSVTLLEERRDVAGMDRAFLAAARSLLRVLADPRRYRSAMASIDVPVLLVHGDRDRLVSVQAARDIAARHPDWRYSEWAGVGHVPQLQEPERLADELLDWMRGSALTRAPA
ncbi:alpha/beta fold hydrolase [Blastococcus saxobsidens]|uniref:Predicted hydrolase or acyltransferase of alpha/beta superfamily n=1 Tax=Blastococcus saxobsidens (strain DD2) TaxID=1146883 RepID=H6RR19_BLASD|nr:alpha/beta hydrolase [Blastococcus saxobsidens]CCG02898.1 Predicted hydrolase or acyltransferase of alpha/beta superfamily [Blastococcus saxobsidens DD2]